MRRRLATFALPLAFLLAVAIVYLPGMIRGEPAQLEAGQAHASASPAPGEERWQDLATSLQRQRERVAAEAPKPGWPKVGLAHQVASRSDPGFFSPSEATFAWQKMTAAFPFPLPPGRSWPTEAPAWMRYDLPQLFQEGTQEAAGADYWRCAWLDAAVSVGSGNGTGARPGLTRERITEMLAADARAPHPWAPEQAQQEHERAIELSKGDASDWREAHAESGCSEILSWPAGPSQIVAPPPGG